jgi:hypothetical protein
MKFFEFSQNNSGGGFDVDDRVTHRVLIEADNAEEATNIGESLGMYWDGCDTGMDCPCCGDRWYRPWSDDGKVFPFTYGSFEKSEAESIVKNYHAELKKSERKKSYGNREWDVVFRTPESYMQYLADNYGWVDPDGYIYYKSGRKVSITGKVRGKK